MGDALAPWHIIILLIVFMVLFGAKRLPGAAQSLGQAMKVFKSETKGLSHDSTDPPAAAAAPLASTPVPAPQPAQTQQQIEQLQRQLNDLQAKTAAADGVTVNGVPLSEAQPKQPS
jgi:sec-independent protein translocase protein TatA